MDHGDESGDGQHGRDEAEPRTAPDAGGGRDAGHADRGFDQRVDRGVQRTPYPCRSSSRAEAARARHAYFELIDGLRNETVVQSDAAARLFPDVFPGGFDAAVAEAMRAQVPILPIDG